MAFLVLVFTANVTAAVNQAAMGGHESGPIYLVARGPFQLLLAWWTYWFAARPPADVWRAT